MSSRGSVNAVNASVISDAYHSHGYRVAVRRVPSWCRLSSVVAIGPFVETGSTITPRRSATPCGVPSSATIACLSLRSKPACRSTPEWPATPSSPPTDTSSDDWPWIHPSRGLTPLRLFRTRAGVRLDTVGRPRDGKYYITMIV